MRVIIAGSRTVCDYSEVAAAVRRSGFNITQVVSGLARGGDMLGIEWADNHSIGVLTFAAQWISKDGERDLSAGRVRNTKMAEYADALVAVWDGESNGTAHMIREMQKRNKPVYVYRVDEL